jgi:hypothetical protein
MTPTLTVIRFSIAGQCADEEESLNGLRLFLRSSRPRTGRRTQRRDLSDRPRRKKRAPLISDETAAGSRLNALPTASLRGGRPRKKNKTGFLLVVVNWLELFPQDVALKDFVVQDRGRKPFASLARTIGGCRIRLLGSSATHGPPLPWRHEHRGRTRMVASRVV